jgi:hypothetical protein
LSREKSLNSKSLSNPTIPSSGPQGGVVRSDVAETDAVREPDKKTLESPHPKIAGLGRVVEKLTPKSTPQDLGILGYVSEVIGRDFLEYTPPEAKAFTLDAIRDARLGKWKKMRALAALLTPGNPFSKAAWKKAGVEALAYLGYEVPPLDAHEIASLRTLLDGPVADVIRARANAGHPAPRSLSELSELLSSKELRDAMLELHSDKMDVDAAIAVAGAVLEQLHEHFDAYAIDKTTLAEVCDERGQLVKEKLDAVPPIVRTLLEDPECGARTILAVRKGAVVTAQVLKKTPEKIIEDLNRFSASLAGGGFLWIDEYVRAGRKLQITEGDIGRKKLQLEAMIEGAEKAIGKHLEKVSESKKIPKDIKEAILEAAAIPDLNARAEALESFALRLDGVAAIEATKLAGLARKLHSAKSADPKAILHEISDRLGNFEDFRKEAVRVSVQGRGSAEEHALAGAIQKSEIVRRYGHEALVQTVTYDYANEATESAQKIINGVAGVAAGGVVMHKLFGDGLMHTFISIFEDVMTDVGEIKSMTGQGIPLSDILKGGRFVGQALTLGGATFAASQAHHFLHLGAAGSAGAGAFGGLLLGIGSCALTCYTSIYSFNLFRRVSREFAREGKFDLGVLIDETKACLGAVAHRAGKPELEADLAQAFDEVRAKFQGVPTGENLAAALAARRPDLDRETLSAIQQAQNDAVKLASTGLDHQELMRELAANLAKSLAEMMKHEGHPIDEAAALRVITEKLGVLEAGKEIDSKRITDLVRECMHEVIDLAPGASALHEKSEQFLKMLETHGRDLGDQLEKKIRDEIKAFAKKAGKDQTIANPVRAMLILGIAACATSLTLVGALLPAFLLGPVGAIVLAFLASSESIVACGGLAIRKHMHEKALQGLAEKFAAEARDPAQRTGSASTTIEVPSAIGT